MLLDIATYGTSLTWLYRWQPEVARLLGGAGIEARIYNPAINGGNSAAGLANVAQIVRLRPKIALVEFSMNDCCTITLAQAEANTVAIINALKSVIDSDSIYLMTMNRPVGMSSSATARSSIASYQAAYRAIAADQAVQLIDIEPLWVSEYISGDIPDGLHPTEASSKRITAPTIAARLLSDMA